jgi:signal transduction histidine kinase
VVKGVLPVGHIGYYQLPSTIMQTIIAQIQLDLLSHDKNESSLIFFLMLFYATAFMLVGFLISLVYKVRRKKEWYFREIVAAKLEVQERTMNYIFKELHSNFSPMASLINIHLSEIIHLNADSSRENILETKLLARKLLSDLDAFSASLSSKHILEIGFPNALAQDLDRINSHDKQLVSFSRSGREYRLEPKQEITLFRLAQELISYIRSYAKDTLLQVQLDYSPKRLSLIITEPGHACTSLAAAIEPAAVKLEDMRNRACFINATLDVRNRPGKGTSFRLRIQNPAI